MHIEFASVDEKYIKDSVKNGHFKSEAEVVRDAVRKQREETENKRLRLLAALKLGEDDITAGRTTPYSRELMHQLREEAIKQVKSGKKIAYDPDVIPPYIQD